jgi:histone deacetylase 1/2
MVTHLKDGIRKPNPKYVLHSSLTNNVTEPTSYTKAVKYASWRNFMQEELTALQKSGTWELVPPNASINVLPNKWIFKIKKKADGSIERYKAKLVANGFH